jgi:hypothetical protein
MSLPHPSAQHRPNSRYLGQFQMPSKRARSVSVISHPLSRQRGWAGVIRTSARPAPVVELATSSPAYRMSSGPTRSITSPDWREAAARSPAAGLPPLPQQCLEVRARTNVAAGWLRHEQRGHHTAHSPSRNRTIQALLCSESVYYADCIVQRQPLNRHVGLDQGEGGRQPMQARD